MMIELDGGDSLGPRMVELERFPFRARPE